MNPLVEGYGQVIVDECHHVGAVSFDAILKRTKAKFVLGLTATPIRRDGQQPIIFMQCGPIRHSAANPTGAPHDLEVLPRADHVRIDLPTDAGIQDVFRQLATDQARTVAMSKVKRNGFGRAGERTMRYVPLKRSCSPGAGSWWMWTWRSSLAGSITTSLMDRLGKRVADTAVLRQIRAYLDAGIMIDGVIGERDQRAPQGGPRSPLLAHVLLDELDRELERRGHCFARYADDCNV